jgi:hypothetical protein
MMDFPISPLQQVAHEVEVLQPQRLIQPVLRSNTRNGLWRAAHPQQDARGVPGDGADHDEDEHADPEQDRQQLERTPEHEAVTVHG